MNPRWLLLVFLVGCGAPPALDEPNEPPPWPMENITDVQRTQRETGPVEAPLDPDAAPPTDADDPAVEPPVDGVLEEPEEPEEPTEVIEEALEEEAAEPVE